MSSSIMALAASTTNVYAGGSFSLAGTNLDSTSTISANLVKIGMSLGTPTTNTLASSLNPADYGVSVTLTSTVSPATVSGTVTFKDGAATLGTAALSAGLATFTTNGLGVGTHTLTAVYSGDATNAPSTSSALTQTVNKLDPGVTNWPTATAITYGQRLTNSTLSGGAAAVPGVFAFTTPSTVPTAGTAPRSVSFTPTDSAHWNNATSTVSVTVNPATPIVTNWPIASRIAPGQVLSASSLSGGVASVAGSFAFDAPTTVPPAGNYSATVRFLPGDALNYLSVTSTVNVAVMVTPSATTLAATSVLGTLATLNGSINPGAYADAFFQYGTSTNLGVWMVGTFAGNYPGYLDATGTAALFQTVMGVATDSSGNVYVADAGNNMIRKITPAGAVTTLAGQTTAGFADGTNGAAQFSWPEGVAVDSIGNVYVADTSNNRIRKITPAGVVTTLAGQASSGSANGNGAAAQFNGPSSVAVDGSGNVYVADMGNNLIRKITPSGDVTTFAGMLASGWVDANGTAAKFYQPYGVAVDGSGNVYVGDTYNNCIRKITSAGLVTTLAGVGAGFGSYLDGTGSTARFNLPAGLVADSVGNIYVSDSANNRIRKITPGGVVTTLAGTGSSGPWNGPGSEAGFSAPGSVAVGGDGVLYVADRLNTRIRSVAIAGSVVLVQSGLTGTNPVPVSLSTTGLIGGTTYYYRAVATNASGTVNGNYLSFTTLSTNASLSALALGSGTLTPSFATNLAGYTSSVANVVTSITVTPT
ncbi:MAG: Ig-like domain repeat protein, partial [Verrucomicrobiota bacterium]